MKKKKLISILMIIVFPISVFAYSNQVIIGGETIGIEVHSKGVYVVGFYPVHGKNIGEEAGFQIGDIIKKVNKKQIQSIAELNNFLENEETYEFQVERNQKTVTISFTLEKEDNILKTGLYVKDQIQGIGTLSYIDPNTGVYGSLGHEILESTSFSRFQINKGKIYKAEVSTIKKSQDGITGEKNAKIDQNDILGTVELNEVEGIFGIYENIPKKEPLEIAPKEEIKSGEAYIRTSIEKDKVTDYSINIISTDDNSTSKNIFFEITDKQLLEKTGGIIQGMSGSPIIQNNKLIGVVNYVIVENVKKGYGIFITTMLEEGDKILQ